MDELVSIAIIAGIERIKVDLHLLATAQFDEWIGEGLVCYPDLQRLDQFVADVRVISLLRCRYDENGEKRGEKQGELKKVKSIAISLAQEGEFVERIARILGETEKTIKEWLAETH